jgi:DNA invertase Pin-like site-specific DNA recombinase
MPRRSHGQTSQRSIATSATQRPRALGVLRISQLTCVTTSPDRQRSTIRRCAEQLGFSLIAEAADLGVSARSKSPFERPSLSIWLRHPDECDALVWSHVDRAVRSVAHMAELIAWAHQHARTLAFASPDDDGPLAIPPQADAGVIQRCMDLAEVAEQEARTLSTRLTSSHAALRSIGRYGGGLVPFGYQKAPHPSGRAGPSLPTPTPLRSSTRSWKTCGKACLSSRSPAS